MLKRQITYNINICFDDAKMPDSAKYIESLQRYGLESMVKIWFMFRVPPEFDPNPNLNAKIDILPNKEKGVQFDHEKTKN